MKPPHASDATLHSGWGLPALRVGRPRLHTSRIGGLGVRARLALLAVVVLAMSLAAVAAWEELAADDAPTTRPPLEPRSSAPPRAPTGATPALPSG